MSDDELMFFDGHSAALPMYERLKSELLQEFPNTRVEVHKTQISFKNRHLYACVSFLPVKRKAQRPDPYLTVTFGLDFPKSSQRIAAVTEVAPNRWTHHVFVGSPEEIDAQLLGWIGEAYRFSEGKR